MHYIFISLLFFLQLNQRDSSNSLITAINFDRKGRRAYVGTYDGKITGLNLNSTSVLEYHTSFDIKVNNRSVARKITNIEQRPHSTSLLITSNDSRIRLYDVEVFVYNFTTFSLYLPLLSISSTSLSLYHTLFSLYRSIYFVRSNSKKLSELPACVQI